MVMFNFISRARSGRGEFSRFESLALVLAAAWIVVDFVMVLK